MLNTVEVVVKATSNYQIYVIEARAGDRLVEQIETTRKRVTTDRNRMAERLAEEYDCVIGTPLPELWEMPKPHEVRGGGKGNPVTDKREMLRQVEEGLGSEGSRELAKHMFDVLEEHGRITFDPVNGYVMQEFNENQNEDYLDLLREADERMEVK
jgi:hypothetical protein